MDLCFLVGIQNLPLLRSSCPKRLRIDNTTNPKEQTSQILGTTQQFATCSSIRPENMKAKYRDLFQVPESREAQGLKVMRSNPHFSSKKTPKSSPRGTILQ